MVDQDIKTIYLTLDLEQDYGTALSTTNYDALQYAEELFTFLGQNNIPITIFIQTDILEKKILPSVIENYSNAEFEPHSCTHKKREDCIMKNEIEKSTRDYEEYFKQKPVGYRFPDGNVAEEDYQVLSDLGYRYDSSIFPFWRPGRFDNSKFNSQPFLTKEKIVEIPFFVENFFLKFPISLSYYKFLGPLFRKKVLKNLPNNVIFDFHMHDLGPIKHSYKQLPFLYKLFYRNTTKTGLYFLKHFIQHCLNHGYKFGLLKNYYTHLSKTLFEV